MVQLNEIVKDLRVAKAILNKICIEHNIERSNVYVNKDYKYIETVNVRQPDADFKKVEYKGQEYKVTYFSGCFNPFIKRIK